ncbi:MAG: hypothetical protein ACI9S8_002520 [Chlamydiales bacterium]|jgi:hypothetical protein
MDRITSPFTQLLIFLILFGTFSFEDAKAQCFQSGFCAEPIGKFTGVFSVDQKFLGEADLISKAFGVTPNLLIMNDFSIPNAIASPLDTAIGRRGTVYFGLSLLLDELWSMTKGEIAVAGILAHEFAHILQFKKGWVSGAVNRELHADYLAGWYLGQRSYHGPLDITGFANSLFQRGDYNFGDPQHHGTPAARRTAMVAGFNQRAKSLNQAYNGGMLTVLGIQNSLGSS